MQLSTVTKLFGIFAIAAAQIIESNDTTTLHHPTMIACFMVTDPLDTNLASTGIPEIGRRVPIDHLWNPDQAFPKHMTRKFGLDAREVSSADGQNVKASIPVNIGPATQVDDGQVQVPTAAAPLGPIPNVGASFPFCANPSSVPFFVPDIDQNGSHILRLVIASDCGEISPPVTAMSAAQEASSLASQPTSSAADVSTPTSEAISSATQTSTPELETRTAVVYASDLAQTSTPQLENSTVTAYTFNMSTGANRVIAIVTGSDKYSTSGTGNAYSTYQSEESSGGLRLQIATAAALTLSVLLAALLF